MAEYIIQDTTLTEIADSIRAKTGKTDSIPVPDMRSQIDSIPSGDDETVKGFIERTLTSITVPDGITKLGDFAFYNFSNLKSVVLPNSVERIGGHTFQSCTYLEKIKLPDGILLLDMLAFYGCTNLMLSELPDTVKKIDHQCFQGCTKLNLKKLPNNLVELINGAFTNCSSLSISEIPAGVTYIAPYVFSNCTGLTKITFKGTPLNKFDSTAFNGCTNLTTINVPWAEGDIAGAPWGATNATINYNYTEEA